MNFGLLHHLSFEEFFSLSYFPAALFSNLRLSPLNEDKIQNHLNYSTSLKRLFAKGLFKTFWSTSFSLGKQTYFGQK